MSYGHFRRFWRQMYGQAPHQFIVSTRLRHACRLLVESEASIGVIAERVGISDPLYFSRLFKKHFQVTPSAYRRRYHQPSDASKPNA
jgi:AraC-like DNA-binding protein